MKKEVLVLVVYVCKREGRKLGVYIMQAVTSTASILPSFHTDGFIVPRNANTYEGHLRQ